MTTACTGVFAMVGGGMVQDQLQFSNKDGSDFHRCGLVDIRGSPTPPRRATRTGRCSRCPTRTTQNSTWFLDFVELFPEDGREVAGDLGDLPSIETVKNKYEAAVGQIDGYEVLDSIATPAAGADDWCPTPRS